MQQLWVEKYRPSSVDGYVFRDADQRDKVKHWVETHNIPHLLFSGAAGTGKTTLAKILINEVGVDRYDQLVINASRENSVDEMRNRITQFSETMPFGEFKVVLLDEADHLSPAAQAALRGIMEQYHTSVRFILTCNYQNRIIPAIHSRCQGFHIENLDKVEFTARVAEILITEQVELDLETLDDYVRVTYPDLRKCINTVQMNGSSGKLESLHGDEGSSVDSMAQVVELFKQKRYTAGRKVLCENIRQDEMGDMFRWCYDNIDLWATTDDMVDDAVLVIREGLVNHSMVADPEINLSATLIKLARVADGVSTGDE